MRGVLAGIVFLALLAPAAGLRAWDRDAAGLVREGQRLFAESRFAEAAERFRHAYAIDPDPNQLYNEARCQEALGALPAAVALYERYLEAKPEAGNRAQVEETVRQLTWTLTRSMRRVTLRTIPPGAVVFLDGAEVPAGRTPLRLWLAPGPHRARLSLEGFPAQEQSFEVSAEGPDWFAVAMVPAPAPVPAPELVPAPVPVPVPVPEIVPVPEATAVPVPEAAPAGFRYPASAIVTTSLTAAGLATGAAMYLLAEGEGARYRLWGNLAFGVAGASALATAILLGVANSTTAAPSVALAPLSGGLAAVWSGQF